MKTTKEPLTHRLQALANTPQMGKLPVNRLIVTDAIACLSTIASILSAEEWDSDTPAFIAETLQEYGIEVKDTDEGEDDDE